MTYGNKNKDQETSEVSPLEGLPTFTGAESDIETGVEIEESEDRLQEKETSVILSKEDYNRLVLAKVELGKVFKKVQGSTPTKLDLAGWTEGKFIDFFGFMKLFIRINDRGESVIQTPEKLVRKVELYLLESNHPYHEFIFRIDRFSSDPAFTTKKFYYRLATLLRQVGKYLKDNPSVVGDALRAVVEPEPRLNWCLKTTKIVETKIGAEIVVHDNGDDIGDGLAKSNVPVTLEKRYLDAVIKATSVFEMVAGSISRDDIKKLSPKDKIVALSRLAFVANLHKNFRGGPSVFKQINIYNASREQLEEATTQFGKRNV